MFIKSDIRKITIALEKDFYSDVYFALGNAGIVHLARFPEKESVMDSGFTNEEARTKEIMAGTEYALNILQIPSGKAGQSSQTAINGANAAFVSSIKKKIERAVRLRKKIKEELDTVARRTEYMDALNKMGVAAQFLHESRFIRTVFGMVNEAVGDISGKKFMIKTSDKYVFGLASPADFPDMLNFLNKYGFSDKSADFFPAPPESLEKRAQTLQRRDAIIYKYLSCLKDEKGPNLRELNAAATTYDDVLNAVRMSFFSDKAMFITGWIDTKDKERLLSILQKICGNRYILTEKKDPAAPVRLHNTRLFRPFELLVKTMGMPSNSEIDPTPFTALTFILMFGLMFGDLGQGLILLMCGVALKKFGNIKLREELEQAGGILIACGGSAALCGLLYGSFFSSEKIIPALLFHPTENIMRLFFSTIVMGVIFILIGLFINIVNSILNADYTEAFLEKRGLSILILYTAIVFFAFNYQETGQLPASWKIIVFIILPLGLFSLRGIISPILFHSAKPDDFTEYLIETVMGIVEIALSLFANTISFIRVGAFALSHAGLSIVTYTLAGMADPALNSAGAITIIVIGNIFIIGFEGLICGIQSIRLEYYEFFSKFFQGNGVAFSPYTLKAY